MESQNSKNQFINNEDESIGNRTELCRLSDENIVFVPTENIRAIERVIMNWEAVKNLWEQTRPTSFQ